MCLGVPWELLFVKYECRFLLNKRILYNMFWYHDSELEVYVLNVILMFSFDRLIIVSFVHFNNGLTFVLRM